MCVRRFIRRTIRGHISRATGACEFRPSAGRSPAQPWSCLSPMRISAVSGRSIAGSPPSMQRAPVSDRHRLPRHVLGGPHRLLAIGLRRDRIELRHASSVPRPAKRVSVIDPGASSSEVSALSVARSGASSATSPSRGPAGLGLAAGASMLLARPRSSPARAARQWRRRVPSSSAATLHGPHAPGQAMGPVGSSPFPAMFLYCSNPCPTRFALPLPFRRPRRRFGEDEAGAPCPKLPNLPAPILAFPPRPLRWLFLDLELLFRQRRAAARTRRCAASR